MSFFAPAVPAPYRQPILGRPGPELRRALTFASSLAGLFLLVVLFAPAPPAPPTTVEELPERFARLILDERPPAPVASAPAGPKTEAPAPEVAEVEAPPAPPVVTRPRTSRTRRAAPVVEADRGQAGRQQAREQVSSQLAQVSHEVESTLESLREVLPTSTRSETATRPRRRGGRAPRAGRSAAAVGGGERRQTGGNVSLQEGALAAGATDLGTLGTLDLASVHGQAGSVSGGGGSGGTGGAPGARSAASLMDVVRRYAPGIRYCYDTALEGDRSLRGKMVLRIHVAADGRVVEVDVIEDTLASADVRSCALTQVRAWRFGAAASGAVFDAPFVFRPSD